MLPPIPTSRPPPVHQPSRSICSATCLRSSFIALPDASSPGRNRSLTRTAPSGSDSASRSSRSSMRVSWMLPPPMSIAKPSASVVEFTTAR